MSRLPQLTGQEVLRALQLAGFELTRIRGSHHYLLYPGDPTRRATVPVHKGRVVPAGTLHNILVSAKISEEELRRLL